VKRAVLVCAGTVCVIALSAVPAYANTTECGSWGYYGPIKGYNYQNQSCIVFNTGSAGSYGSIWVETQHGANVPSGWMGEQPRVFTSNGAVCIAGSWYYNSGSASGIGDAVYRPAATCGSGYYYSAGLTRAWNGYGYDTYSSFRSPNLYL
jgi:hypothetical protein